MAKWRDSVLMVFTTLTMVSFMPHAQAAMDDVMSPDEIAADEPVTRAPLPPPDVPQDPSCPARIMIFVDKSQSTSASVSPLVNTKPDNQKSQTMQVFVDCKLTYNWPVSTGRERQEVATFGKHYFSETPAGNYRLDWRTTAYHSRLWNAPMPFAQFFLPGIAIHATEPSEYRKLGRRASGGCVRLHMQNAQALYGLVDKIGAQNVLITISDGQPFQF